MSTRSKKKQLANSNTQILIKKRVENSWVLLVKESLIENSNFTIITLPNPAHESPTKYCLDSNNNKMYEVITFNEPYRSWFIDDSVKSDGSMMLVTPINPLFLILPRLREQCMDRAVPLEDLLSDKGFEKILGFITNLDAVADLKGPQDIRAYKYNEEKTLAWLHNKICKLADILKKKNIHVTSGAISATFVTSNLDKDNIDEEFYLKYAHGMIAEYLEDDVVKLLEKKFNFKTEPIEHVGNKRKSEVEIDSTNKRVKNESNEEEKLSINNSNNSSNVKKQKPISTKEKTRQKAASGTKTISSFFCKK